MNGQSHAATDAECERINIPKGSVIFSPVGCENVITVGTKVVPVSMS